MSSATLQNEGNIELTQSFLEIEWKIPNFFSCEKKYDKFESPAFDFLGVEWFIRLFRHSGEFLKLCIYKRTVGAFKDLVYYTIGIKCFDGEIYKSASGVKEVQEFDIYGNETQFVRLSDLKRDKQKIAPQDVLIIFCKLGTKQEYCERSVADVTTRTDVSDGAHARNGEAEMYLDWTENEVSEEKVDVRDLKGTYKLADDLKELFLNETHFDTTIKIAGKEFRAHRAILVARSSVFKAMFSHDTSERNTGMVEIEDCDPDVFQDFLLFFYSGRVEKMSLENVGGLYTLADKYDVPEVKIQCMKFMRSNFCEDYFCDFIALALIYNEIELLKEGTLFFAKNTKQIISTSKWQCFLKQYPTECNELYIKAIQYRDEA